MRTTSAELKKRAKNTLKGNYGLCIGIMLLISLLTIVIVFLSIFGLGIYTVITFKGFYSTVNPVWQMVENLIFALVVGFVIVAVIGLLGVGMNSIYMKLSRGQSADIGDVLYAFGNSPLKFLGLLFLIYLINLLISVPQMVVQISMAITGNMVLVILYILIVILTYVGSIIFSYSVSQSVFILIDSPDKGVIECMKESFSMMKGHKGRLFYVNFSFFGMVLLGYCSMGIGLLWVFPYMQCTLAQFYLDLKQSQEPEPYITYEAYEAYDINRGYETNEPSDNEIIIENGYKDNNNIDQ
jgi:uncharacterized membrane protein